MEIERRRLTAIQQAEKDGNWIRKMRLQAAGIPHLGDSICFLCDPIRAEPVPSDADENIESDSRDMHDIDDSEEQKSGELAGDASAQSSSPKSDRQEKELEVNASS